MRAGNQITLRVTPMMCFAPADVVINATIESHADNRVLRVAAESPDFYRPVRCRSKATRPPGSRNSDSAIFQEGGTS
jgi:hypothetical protein